MDVRRVRGRDDRSQVALIDVLTDDARVASARQKDSHRAIEVSDRTGHRGVDVAGTNTQAGSELVGRSSFCDQVHQKGTQGCAGLFGLRVRRRRGDKVLNRRREHRLDQIGLGGEVPVDGACTDSGTPGDLVKGHVRPLGRERSARRGHHLGAVGDRVRTERRA